MVVDGVWATIGTTNFDSRSFAHNEESNVCSTMRTGRADGSHLPDDLRACASSWSRGGTAVSGQVSGVRGGVSSGTGLTTSVRWCDGATVRRRDKVRRCAMGAPSHHRTSHHRTSNFRTPGHLRISEPWAPQNSESRRQIELPHPAACPDDRAAARSRLRDRVAERVERGARRRRCVPISRSPPNSRGRSSLVHASRHRRRAPSPPAAGRRASGRLNRPNSGNRSSALATAIRLPTS